MIHLRYPNFQNLTKAPVAWGNPEGGGGGRGADHPPPPPTEKTQINSVSYQYWSGSPEKSQSYQPVFSVEPSRLVG